MTVRIALLLIALWFPLNAVEAAKAYDPVPDPRVMSNEGFLGAHPDLRWRQQGLKAYEQGDYPQAFEHFTRAARFADKPSQGMLAEMLWRGEGVTQDRALAYAWMDVAAERRFRTMLIRREVYWEGLDASERERALEVGKTLYSEYGDAVAQPRLESKLRRGKRRITGSRTGFVGNLTIVINTLAGPLTIPGSSFYHPDYWEPARYWQWQEKGWKDPPRGSVDVGPLSTPAPTPTSETPPPNGSR